MCDYTKAKTACRQKPASRCGKKGCTENIHSRYLSIIALNNISECEILPDGSRRLHKLYEYHITDNHLEDNRFIIEGEHRKCEEISESLRRRFIENGMPLGELAQFVQGKEEDE